MSFSSVVKTLADGAQLAAEGLDAISAVVSNPVVKTADEIVMAVAAILASLKSAQAGALTPDQVRAELAKLKSDLALGDADADVAAEAKS